ncbi:heterokaryon incompatibility domain-containing protein [Trichoderma barbatum]
MEESRLKNITTQPGTYLCQYCKTQSCGAQYPNWLGSDRYMDGLRQISAQERRSEYSHSSYEAFLAAADEGCFICKTLTAGTSSVGSKVSSFDMTYMKSPIFTCRLSFAILIPSQLETQDNTKSPVGRSFILQGLDRSTNISIKRLSSGATNSYMKSFVLNALETCIKDHASCGQDNAQQEASPKRYPTRLVDVGSPASERCHVKLIETEHTLPEGPYVTLSHCWGNAATVFKLERANKESLLNELPPLAKTFEEAIEREAGLMANVYRNALCNISATASSNSNGGLFNPRNDVFTGISLTYPERHEELLLVREELEVVGDVEFAAVQKRGWVLQERLLSPRIVHFTKRQLAWECNELVASETFPNGLPPFWTYYYVPNRIRANAQKTLSTAELFEAWGDILERYTNASLTFRSDLLPALSGIAKYIQGMSGATYLTGIWKTQQKCVVNLAWQCEPNVHRPTDYRAPSWSWASTDNPVTFEPFKSTSGSHGDGWFGSVKTRSEVIDAQITAAISDLTGPASSGFLIIEGPFNRITIGPGLEVTLDEKELEMTISFDEPENMYRGGSLFILPLYSYHSEHDHEDGVDQLVYVYLVLSLAKEPHGCYSRCGLGRVTTWNYERPPIWDKVVNGMDALCDEFLDLDRGHRIRVI